MYNHNLDFKTLAEKLKLKGNLLYKFFKYLKSGLSKELQIQLSQTYHSTHMAKLGNLLDQKAKLLNMTCSQKILVKEIIGELYRSGVLMSRQPCT